MLEEHVVPWLKEWHLGSRMMGEQGAESIHAYFNRLGKMFDVMLDRLQRLKHKMKEHLLHVAPANIAAKPPIKKRKIDSTQSQPIFVLFIFAYTPPMPTPSLLLPTKVFSHSHTFTSKLSAHVSSRFNAPFLSIFYDRVTPTEKKDTKQILLYPNLSLFSFLLQLTSCLQKIQLCW